MTDEIKYEYGVEMPVPWNWLQESEQEDIDASDVVEYMTPPGDWKEMKADPRIYKEGMCYRGLNKLNREKYIKDHIEELPNEYEELVLKRIGESRENDPCWKHRHSENTHNFEQAISSAFDWAKTPEGFDFWERVSLYGEKQLPHISTEVEEEGELVEPCDLAGFWCENDEYDPTLITGFSREGLVKIADEWYTLERLKEDNFIFNDRPHAPASEWFTLEELEEEVRIQRGS
jgi:hypothetical protein